MSITYKDAGLDLDLYDQAMARLPALMKRTHTPRVIDLEDGFAGLFRLDQSRYRDPVLVSGTDGVGTKIKVAILAGKYDTVGIDLVAMSVNDCLCVGAEPLFFLDYVALGKDDPVLIPQIVKGVSEGCVQAGAALLGGETAIMPDIYAPGDFDLAGFCVGVVERERIVDGQAIVPGDVLIGVESSGFHSNGYSLVRKVVFEHAGLKIDQHIAELGQTVGEALLQPTRIYARPLADLLRDLQLQPAIHGIAHITGEGIAGNLERILPAGCQAVVDCGTWRRPAVFDWLQKLGDIATAEMYRVFNMGVGLILVVPGESARSVRDRLAGHQLATWQIGAIRGGERNVLLEGGGQG